VIEQLITPHFYLAGMLASAYTTSMGLFIVPALQAAAPLPINISTLCSLA
jgi:hypothetical protein